MPPEASAADVGAGEVSAADIETEDAEADAFCLRYALPRYQVPMAPISVGRGPKMMSGSAEPMTIFPRRQPINSPGMAADVKKGRTVRASEKRTWMFPLAMPSALASIVSTT